jgi:hypothetical protein
MAGTKGYLAVCFWPYPLRCARNECEKDGGNGGRFVRRCRN